MTVRYARGSNLRIPHFWRTAWRRDALAADIRDGYAETPDVYANAHYLSERGGYYNTGD